MFLASWCDNFARNVGGNLRGKAMERPKYLPRALKMSPGGPKMRPRGAKKEPRAAKKQQEREKCVFFPFFVASRTAQERPRAPQERPKSA